MKEEEVRLGLQWHLDYKRLRERFSARQMNRYPCQWATDALCVIWYLSLYAIFLQSKGNKRDALLPGSASAVVFDYDILQSSATYGKYLTTMIPNPRSSDHSTYIYAISLGLGSD